MEWSLVLASQAIESTILRPEAEGPWRLLVEPADLPRACDSIRQYRLEQMSWYWRYRVPVAGVLFHWGALAWFFLFLLIAALDLAASGELKQIGLADAALIRQGQWWRLVTATWLHADIAHLAVNASMAFVFGGLAMAQFGAAWAWVGISVAGALGNLPALLFYPELHRSLGGSGMVMAALGMMTIRSLSLFRFSRHAYKPLAKSLMAGLLLFILFGLNPNSDVLAHAGGFVGGLTIGAVLAWTPSSWLNTIWTQGLVVLGWTCLFLVCWALALTAPLGI